VVAGILLAAAVPVPAPVAGEIPIYHLTDGEELSVRQALDALAAPGQPAASLSLPSHSSTRPPRCRVGGPRAGEPAPASGTRYGARLLATNCRYDIGKARRELGYRPTVTFEAGWPSSARLGL